MKLQGAIEMNDLAHITQLGHLDATFKRIHVCLANISDFPSKLCAFYSS